MKIAFFEVPKEQQDFFRNSFTVLNSSPSLEVSFYEEKLDKNNLANLKDLEMLCVFTNSMVSKEIIDTF